MPADLNARYLGKGFQHFPVHRLHRSTRLSPPRDVRLVGYYNEKIAGCFELGATCLHVRRGASGVASLYLHRGYVRTQVGDLDYRPDVFLEAYWLKL